MVDTTLTTFPNLIALNMLVTILFASPAIGLIRVLVLLLSIGSCTQQHSDNCQVSCCELVQTDRLGQHYDVERSRHGSISVLC